jgi:hypothetical protein
MRLQSSDLPQPDFGPEPKREGPVRAFSNFVRDLQWNRCRHKLSTNDG